MRIENWDISENSYNDTIIHSVYVKSLFLTVCLSVKWSLTKIMKLSSKLCQILINFDGTCRKNWFNKNFIVLKWLLNKSLQKMSNFDYLIS